MGEDTRLILIVITASLFMLGVMAMLTTPVCLLAGPGTAYPKLQSAIQAAQPGCTVLLVGGEFRENLLITKPIRLLVRSGNFMLVRFTQAGSERSSFAIFAAPPKTVTISAADSQRPAIEIRSEGVELRGLQIRGGTPAILITNARRVSIINNRISQSAHAAITLQNASEITLSQNEISQNETGILLEDASRNRLLSNLVQNNSRGVVLKNSHENTLYANRILAHPQEGLLLEASHRNELIENTSGRNSFGLLILSSQGNRLRANRLERNDYGLRVWGEAPEHFLQRIERTNTIDAKAVYYLVKERNLTISAKDQPSFVALIDSEKITVEGVSLGRGSEGILLINTRNSTIRNNVLSETIRGIYLWNSSQNEIAGNRLERTQGSGLALIHSSGNRLSRNILMNSGAHGVLLQDSQDNQLIENQMMGNRESGVHLRASRRNSLERNQIQGNWVGVFLEGGGLNVIRENWIRDGQFGIFAYQSVDNRLIENRLENNRHGTNVAEEPPPPSPKPPQQPPSGGG